MPFNREKQFDSFTHTHTPPTYHKLTAKQKVYLFHKYITIYIHIDTSIKGMLNNYLCNQYYFKVFLACALKLHTLLKLSK